jgi:hypothetical protein
MSKQVQNFREPLFRDSRDVQEVENSCWPGGHVFIAPNRKELDEKIAKWKPKDVSLEDFEARNLLALLTSA